MAEANQSINDIQHGEFTTDDMTERCQTFPTIWSTEKPTPEKLATAGFIYKGGKDQVECFKCHIRIADWEEDDDPWKEHAEHNPHCPHVRHYKGRQFVENILGSPAVINEVTTDQSKQGNHNEIAKFPEYSTSAKRGESYETWPDYLPVKPDTLIKAGFFYAGVGDIVKCYHCGGGLRNWVEGDVPFEQHAISYPNCSYLIMNKGQLYVNDIQNGQRESKYRAQKKVSLELNDPINSAAAQSCVQMGYSKESVLDAIERYKNNNDGDIRNLSGELLYKIIESQNDACQQTDDALPNPFNTSVQEQVPEMSKTKDKTTCKMCLCVTTDIAILPCGHPAKCQICPQEKGPACQSS